MKFQASKTDYMLAAIYNLGFAQKLDRVAIVSLITSKTNLAELKAKQLAGHWLGSYAARTR